MTKTHSLKLENKPTLFSFDIDTEYKNIERWILDNKRYSKRDLETEANLLKQIVEDYIEIIETNILTETQLNNVVDAIKRGASGVWEPATTKLERLSYYFENAKAQIMELIKNESSQTVERLLNCVSDNFDNMELIELFTFTFANKSKRVKMKTANIALNIREAELIPFLKDELNKQTDKKVKEAIQFSIDNMWQPKGQLTIKLENNAD